MSIRFTMKGVMGWFMWATIVMNAKMTSTSAGPAVICEHHHDRSLFALKSGPCPSESSVETRLAGANVFDAMWNANPGQGIRGEANLTVTIEALTSFHASGLRVFRYFADLWGPNQVYWVREEDAYWAAFDAVVDEIDRLGDLYTIPSIGYSSWHLVANEAYPGLNETMNDFVLNETSVSRRLARRYFKALTSRYVDRKSILLWELGNELNLQVNLPPHEAGTKTFNTSAMVSLMTDLVSIVRAVDDTRPISSGHSSPRSSAWHMEHCEYPGNATCPFWGIDTRSQWLEMLRRQNEPCEVWSIHHYDKKDNCYFGKNVDSCVSNASLATIAASHAQDNGAVLFVGEFGGPSPNFTGPTQMDQVFPSDMLRRQAADQSGAFVLSTIWAWMCPSHRDDMRCIWPNSSRPSESGSARMLSVILDANRNMTSRYVARGAHRDITPQRLTYGKYYGKDTNDINDYYLFTPTSHDPSSSDEKLPVIVEFHGGGFTGGHATTTANAMIAGALSNGIAWISVNYRLVATRYYFEDEKSGSEQLEELIHVDDEGRLTLDTNGSTMEDYDVRRGRQEFNTKCSYDATQMMEHLIAHADELGLDVHRISFTGGSAGGGEIHYLTWIYHRWNAKRYTPRGMVYTMAQLDYPVQNMLDRTWSLWSDDIGESTLVSDMLRMEDCDMIVGNPWCSQEADYDLCNETYEAFVQGHFCGSEDAFERATLADVRDACVWPRDDPDVGRGMEKLWYTSLNMRAYQPKPFYLYVANQLNTTAGMNVVHNALYARQFARIANEAGVNYTTYFTDYVGMTDKDTSQTRFAVPSRDGETIVYNYFSSHDWIDHTGVRSVARASSREQLLFHCLALGVESCNVH